MSDRHSPTSIVSIAVIALVALLAAAGCNVGFEGQSGNLEFTYETDEFSSKKALAVESNVRINAALSENFQQDDESDSDENGSDSSTSEQVEVTGVESNRASVIAVEQFAKEAKHSFVLAAESAGTADITVDVETSDGTTVTDAFTLEAKKAERIEVTHPCRGEDDGPDPIYLTNQSVALGKTLYAAGDRALTGRGYNPVSVSGPSSAAKLGDPANDANLLNIETGDSAGTVTISPEIGGSSLDIEVKSDDAIDSIGWFGEGENPSLLPVDDANAGYAIPRFDAGDRRVCKPDIVPEIDNKTSSVCSVTVEHFEPGKEILTEYVNAQTVLKVTAKKKGDCKFEMTVNEATASAEIDVSELLE